MTLKTTVLCTLILASCGVPQNQDTALREDINRKSIGDSAPLSVKSALKVNDQKQTVVTLTIGEHRLDSVIREDGTLASIEGHGWVMTQEEKDLLTQRAIELSSNPKYSEMAMTTESLTYRSISFLTMVPVDAVVPTQSYEQLGLIGNNSVVCLTKGKTYTARWNNFWNQWFSRNIVADHNDPDKPWGYFSCQGRCGIACGGRGLTKDCLNHDVCSFQQGWALGQDCSDELAAAADDAFNKCPI